MGWLLEYLFEEEKNDGKKVLAGCCCLRSVAAGRCSSGRRSGWVVAARLGRGVRGGPVALLAGHRG